MPISTGDIHELLVPGIAAIQGSDYQDYKAQWTECYKVYPSDKFQEVVQEVRLLAPGQLKPQGASVAFDNNMGTRASVSYYNKTFGLAYTMTAESVADNLYQSYFPMANKALKSSLDSVKETTGASTFNNGYTVNGYDGVPLFSTAHPYDGGTIANTFQAPLGLSEAALEAALTGIDYFKSPAGIYAKIKPVKLICNKENQWQAERLLASQFRVGVANNDVNAIYNTNAIPLGYRTNVYLNKVSGQNPWFILTDCEGLRHFVRQPLTVNAYTEFTTGNVQVGATERYSFGYDNFRTVYGSYGN